MEQVHVDPYYVPLPHHRSVSWSVWVGEKTPYLCQVLQERRVPPNVLSPVDEGCRVDLESRVPVENMRTRTEGLEVGSDGTLSESLVRVVSSH